MTCDELLAAGFHEFKPQLEINGWDRGFQLRISDELGVQYFVQCYFWQHTKHHHHPLANIRDGWEVEVHYNNGCRWALSRSAIRITAWAGVEEWTVAQVLEFAAGLWDRLLPEYYEKS